MSPAAFAYTELSFGQYWLQDWYGMGIAGWTGYALGLMLFVQALTIISGFLMIFKNTRSSILLPALLNSLIVVIMIIVSDVMSEGYAKTFQLRFWLTLLSFAPFLLAAIVYHFPYRH